MAPLIPAEPPISTARPKSPLWLSGERGWEIEPMTYFIQTIADPSFETFLPAYRQIAHVIIDNPGRPPLPQNKDA